MAETEKKKIPTKVTTEKVRFSYCYIFNKRPPSKEGESSKYGAQLLISKKHNKKTIADIEKAVAAAIEIGKVKFKWTDKLIANAAKFHMPLRDGDAELEEDEKKDAALYKGMMFVNASSQQKPGILDRDKTPITDSNDFLSGYHGRATLNFYPYDQGQPGIACGLNNIQKISEGEVLGGRARAEDDFDEYEDEDDV